MIHFRSSRQRSESNFGRENVAFGRSPGSQRCRRWEGRKSDRGTSDSWSNYTDGGPTKRRTELGKDCPITTTPSLSSSSPMSLSVALVVVVDVIVTRVTSQQANVEPCIILYKLSKAWQVVTSAQVVKSLTSCNICTSCQKLAAVAQIQPSL